MPRRLLVVSAHSADFVWRAAGAIATVVAGRRHGATWSRSRTASAASRASCGRRTGRPSENVKEIRHGEAEAAARARRGLRCLDLGDYPLVMDAAPSTR